MFSKVSYGIWSSNFYTKQNVQPVESGIRNREDNLEIISSVIFKLETSVNFKIKWKDGWSPHPSHLHSEQSSFYPGFIIKVSFEARFDIQKHLKTTDSSTFSFRCEENEAQRSKIYVNLTSMFLLCSELLSRLLTSYSNSSCMCAYN